MENKRYTCKEYREEMVLAGLKKRLADPKLEKSEEKVLLQQIQKLEAKLGLS